MNSSYKIALALTVIAGCSSGNGATTTTASVAPPTPPSTTSSTTTIVPATTRPPSPPSTEAPATTTQTTIETDENEANKAAIVARYDAFSAASDRCFAAPTECDLPAVLGEFSSADNDLFEFYKTWWMQYSELGQHVERSDQIERDVKVVEVDNDIGLLVACVVDARVLVDQDGQVVDDGVGRRREETFWSVSGGDWRIADASLYNVDESGDPTCDL